MMKVYLFAAEKICMEIKKGAHTPPVNESDTPLTSEFIFKLNYFIFECNENKRFFRCPSSLIPNGIIKLSYLLRSDTIAI